MSHWKSDIIVGRDDQTRAAEVVSTMKTFRNPLQLMNHFEMVQKNNFVALTK